LSAKKSVPFPYRRFPDLQQISRSSLHRLRRRPINPRTGLFEIMKTYMSKPIQFKNTTTLSAKSLISWSRLRVAFIVLPLAFACFALVPAPKAFGVSPPPDGGYPNNNTAEGKDALFSLTTGDDNTAIGYHALYSNTTRREQHSRGS
jgi:hypothetical protein